MLSPGSCWVEISTLQSRFGTPSSYSIVTCVLPSGRTNGSVPSSPDLGQSLREPVREPDRHRHEVSGLVAGVAEHHPLVARADLVVVRRPSPLRSSYALSTPWAMSDDCSSIDVITAHELPSKPYDASV